MPVYKHCRSLSRGLQVLCALNTDNGATMGELSSATGLHRTTIHRLIETLVTEGYLERFQSKETFRLTHNVRRLSEGYTAGAWVTEVASPIMTRLAADIVWPVDLLTLDGDAMVVRETTHRISPFSIHRNMIGHRWPVASSAAGRAYLAHCSEAERGALLHTLAASALPGNQAVRRRGYGKQLATVRVNGHAVSVSECDARMTAISLPVLLDGQVAACLTMVYFTSTMPPTEALRRYLPALQAATASIGQGMASVPGPPMAGPLNGPPG